MMKKQEKGQSSTSVEAYDPLVRQLQKLGHEGFAKFIRGLLHTLTKSTKNETVFASALFETGTFLNQPMDDIIAQGKFEFITTTYNLVINKFQVRALIKALVISENVQVIQFINRELEKKLQRDEAVIGTPSITLSYHTQPEDDQELDNSDTKIYSSILPEKGPRMHAHLGHTYSCPMEGTESEPLLPPPPPTKPAWEKTAVVILGIIIVLTILVVVLIVLFPQPSEIDYEYETTETTTNSSD